MPSIDLNADLGEHEDATLDEQIMPFLSSCNIACGGHAGNDRSIRDTVRLAKRNGVAIGAHPSYPDRENFGRKHLDMPAHELRECIAEQIEWVERICCEEEAVLHHVKPHGALYNAAAGDVELAELICSSVAAYDGRVKLYGLAHAKIEQVAEALSVPFVAEAFADRKYEEDGSLRSRKEAGAVISQLKEVLTQVEELVINHRAFASDWVSIRAQTICLHGDTEGAVTLAKRINEHLVNKGIHIITV